MRKSAPLFCALLLSLSARRAWIEIWVLIEGKSHENVALRKESVDRNITEALKTIWGFGSLSARRAWIEMLWRGLGQRPRLVALRKDSVDRNRRHEDGSLRLDTSLSARRAWIEMRPGLGYCAICTTSLSARRAWIEIRKHRTRGAVYKGRSPQGERG